ncbi:RmlC-like cupin domain-containing protein [Bombardia bombarda]|uniref:RmlC-like cupin domain-containing protein n=1 Tax=Bombardia bombarda TaxID=252184 RepID=A0AA39TWJ6_9PEZI|nr:RmlC-like cupin domain-containing protein [Bombardia bombarda]
MTRVSRILLCLVATLVALCIQGTAAANANANANPANLIIPRNNGNGIGNGNGNSGSKKPIEKRSALDVIKKLNLTANPEKGYFVETFRDPILVGFNGTSRAASTAIYYLLEGAVGQSIWHRVDAVEVWHYYAGAPLTLSLSFNNGTGVRKTTLGPDVFDNQKPQVVIGQWEWQQARSLGEWTLVGTTVAPGFDPSGSGYEIAGPGFNPT